MSERSTPVPGRPPRSLAQMLQADRRPAAGSLAETLLAFPERTIRATPMATDTMALSFTAADGARTAVLRLTVTLPPSLCQRPTVHPGAELSVGSDGAPDLYRPLGSDYAWQLVVRLCRSEYERLSRSSSQRPEQELPIGAVSRILLDEAIEAIAREASLVFFDGGVRWAANVAARGAAVSFGTPEEVTAIAFLPPRSDRALVIDRTSSDDATVADALRAFGGERLVEIGQMGAMAHKDPIGRMLADHWRWLEGFELPDPHPRGTYVSIRERRVERLADPDEHHRRLIDEARKAVADELAGTETDGVLALLWADCCRLRKGLARKAGERDYQPRDFHPADGPPDAIKLALAVACGHVAPDHRVLRELECDAMAAALAESASYARRLARLPR